MLTVIAFLVGLGLLIAVHEYGHYRVAVASGVKVLRFSVGFGLPVLRWQPKNQKNGQSTEFVLGAFPLGGYVRMLDEREGPVPVEDRHLAFNTQRLFVRAAIVVAGPAANLLLAVFLYALVNWSGMQEPKAVLASPVKESLAERAGLLGGELVKRAGFKGEASGEMLSYETLRWLLTRGALDGRDVVLTVSSGQEGATREVVLPLSMMKSMDADAEMFRRIGLLGPWTKPEIGDVTPGSPADLAGLKKGDLVLRVGNRPVIDGQQLRQLIRSSIDSGRAVQSTWQVERQGQVLSLSVKPEIKRENGLDIGRIGAYVGAMPTMVMVRHGPLDGLWRGVLRTWEVSVLTLHMMGRMVVGDASLKNLSGPLTIADYAGKSASLGVVQYLVFLALISVSLGVLNLLPLPVLDGGHLMYYLWEGLSGKGVSEVWIERLQRGGVALLLLMMAVALFNDVSRFFG